MENNYYNYHITNKGLVYSYEKNRYLKPSKQVANGEETSYLCLGRSNKGRLKGFKHIEETKYKMSIAKIGKQRK